MNHLYQTFEFSIESPLKKKDVIQNKLMIDVRSCAFMVVGKTKAAAVNLLPLVQFVHVTVKLN